MNKANLFLILGLAGGAVLGLLASGTFGGVGSGAEGSAPATKMDAHHDHDRMQEAPPDALPSVQVDLQAEGGCTYNMQLTMENFRLAPEAVNTAHKDGEGHAHLFADGVKLARLYSEWFHFAAPLGSKSITVTLNSNDHAVLVHENKPITATAQLTDC